MKEEKIFLKAARKEELDTPKLLIFTKLTNKSKNKIRAAKKEKLRIEKEKQEIREYHRLNKIKAAEKDREEIKGYHRLNKIKADERGKLRIEKEKQEIEGYRRMLYGEDRINKIKAANREEWGVEEYERMLYEDEKINKIKAAKREKLRVEKDKREGVKRISQDERLGIPPYYKNIQRRPLYDWDKHDLEELKKKPFLSRTLSWFNKTYVTTLELLGKICQNDFFLSSMFILFIAGVGILSDEIDIVQPVWNTYEYFYPKEYLPIDILVEPPEERKLPPENPVNQNKFEKCMFLAKIAVVVIAIVAIFIIHND